MRTSKTQPKVLKKRKQTINEKIRKRKPYAIRTRGYKMTINDNKENLRQENNHLSKID